MEGLAKEVEHSAPLSLLEYFANVVFDVVLLFAYRTQVFIHACIIDVVELSLFASVILSDLLDY